MQILIGAIAEGLLWSLMAIGIYISIRILKRPDLTTEGSFPFGGAVATILIINDVHPIFATLFSISMSIPVCSIDTCTFICHIEFRNI